MVSFTKQKSPLVVSVVKETTARAAMAALRNGKAAGATAFDVHLATLLPEERTEEKLKSIFSQTTLPVMALHYNQDMRMQPMTETDEDRTMLFCRAVRCGAGCVDLQGYTFGDRDPRATLADAKMPFAAENPCEVTASAETIARQKEFIREIHGMGGEVLLSVHTGVYMDCEKTLALADFLMEREPDALKLVGVCDTPEQLAEYVKTVPALCARFPGKAMHYHCNGKFGQFTRLCGPLLGSYLVFCIDRFDTSSVMNQLPLRETAEIYRLMERL